jgi:hypothetical protein
MAYFSNGTQTDYFEQTNCFDCIHFSEDEFCPVMDAHLEWGAEAVQAGEQSTGMKILNMLIQEEHLLPTKCTMRKVWDKDEKKRLK